MLRFVRSRLFRVRHALGTGRAVENARREHAETERCLAELTVLEARLTATRAA
jgi:hypothetical protein